MVVLAWTSWKGFTFWCSVDLSRGWQEKMMNCIPQNTMVGGRRGSSRIVYYTSLGGGGRVTPMGSPAMNSSLCEVAAETEKKEEKPAFSTHSLQQLSTQ